MVHQAYLCSASSLQAVVEAVVEACILLGAAQQRLLTSGRDCYIQVSCYQQPKAPLTGHWKPWLLGRSTTAGDFAGARVAAGMGVTLGTGTEV